VAGLIESKTAAARKGEAVDLPQPWVLNGSQAMPLAFSVFTAPSTSSHIRKSLCLSFSSEGWTASSAGGRVKISQPWPTSNMVEAKDIAKDRPIGLRVFRIDDDIGRR